MEKIFDDPEIIRNTHDKNQIIKNFEIIYNKNPKKEFYFILFDIIKKHNLSDIDTLDENIKFSSKHFLYCYANKIIDYIFPRNYQDSLDIMKSYMILFYCLINDNDYNKSIAKIVLYCYSKNRISPNFFESYVYFFDDQKLKENILNELKIDEYIDLCVCNNDEINNLNNFHKPCDISLNWFDGIKKAEIGKIQYHFTKKAINENYNKLLEINKKDISCNINDIIIDDINLYKSKGKKNNIHIYTPLFLIKNGLQKNFQKNDFELFNEDNYNVVLFAKFLEQIIKILNEFIEKGNNGIITQYKLNLKSKNNLYYIGAFLDSNFKEKYYEKLDKNENLTQQNISGEYFKRIKIEKKNSFSEENRNINDDEEFDDNDICSSFAENLRKNFQKEIADDIEKKILNLFNDENKNNIQNILFFLITKSPITIIKKTKLHLNQYI